LYLPHDELAAHQQIPISADVCGLGGSLEVRMHWSTRSSLVPLSLLALVGCAGEVVGEGTVDRGTGKTGGAGTSTSSSDTSTGGAGNTSSTPSTDSGGTASGTGGTSSSTTDSTTSGSGGTTEKTCSSVTVASGTAASIVNFDDAAPNTVPGDSLGAENGLYVGFYSYFDEEGAPKTFQIVSGGQSGNALEFKIGQTGSWIGGFGMWATCMDVRAYSGVSFYAKGSAGRTVKLTMNHPNTDEVANGGNCVGNYEVCVAPSTTFVLSSSWQKVEIRWSQLSAGTANLVSVPFDPALWHGIGFGFVRDDWGTKADFELSIDEVAFF
jgi:hypothetical protein